LVIESVLALALCLQANSMMHCARALRTTASSGQWSWGSWSSSVKWSVPGAPPLQIHQPPSAAVFSSGFRVWPASEVIAGYLIKQGLVSGARVLEIGSGTGALGLACAAAGAERVVLTERTFDDAQPSRRYLDLLEQNASGNQHVTGGAQVIVDELDFQKPELVERVLRNHGPFDLVIGCEMMYEHSTHPDLASALSMMHHAQEPGATQVFLCEFQRTGPENLKEALANVGLDTFEVYSEGEAHGKIAVFKVVEDNFQLREHVHHKSLKK